MRGRPEAEQRTQARLLLFRRQDVGPVLPCSKSILTWALNVECRLVDIVLVVSYFTQHRKLIVNSELLYCTRSSLCEGGFKVRVGRLLLRLQQHSYFDFRLFLNGNYIDPDSVVRRVHQAEPREELVFDCTSPRLPQQVSFRDPDPAKQLLCKYYVTFEKKDTAPSDRLE